MHKLSMYYRQYIKKSSLFKSQNEAEKFQCNKLMKSFLYSEKQCKHLTEQWFRFKVCAKLGCGF